MKKIYPYIFVLVIAVVALFSINEFAFPLAWLPGMLSGSGGSYSSASCVQPPSIGEQVNGANLVFAGAAKDMRSAVESVTYYNEDTGTEETTKRIFTYITFSDLEVLKGVAGNEYTLKIDGGCLLGYCETTSVTPQFKVGERYLLFLGGPFPPSQCSGAYLGKAENVNIVKSCIENGQSCDVVPVTFGVPAQENGLRGAGG